MVFLLIINRLVFGMKVAVPLVSLNLLVQCRHSGSHKSESQHIWRFSSFSLSRPDAAQARCSQDTRGSAFW